MTFRQSCKGSKHRFMVQKFGGRRDFCSAAVNTHVENIKYKAMKVLEVTIIITKGSSPSCEIGPTLIAL